MLKKLKHLALNSKKFYLVMIFIVIPGSYVSYNLFLDFNERSDLRSYLVDLETLRDEASAHSGQELVLEADCSLGTIEKTNSIYNCHFVIENPEVSTNTAFMRALRSTITTNLASLDHCGVLSDLGGSTDKERFVCRLDIRPSNEAFAEELFVDYDTSPLRTP